MRPHAVRSVLCVPEGQQMALPCRPRAADLCWAPPPAAARLAHHGCCSCARWPRCPSRAARPPRRFRQAVQGEPTRLDQGLGLPPRPVLWGWCRSLRAGPSLQNGRQRCLAWPTGLGLCAGWPRCCSLSLVLWTSLGQLHAGLRYTPHYRAPACSHAAPRRQLPTPPPAADVFGCPCWRDRARPRRHRSHPVPHRYC